jgi:hypothetical protein
MPTLLMEKAPGQQFAKFPADKLSTISRAEFAGIVRRASYAQLTNFITGQRDHHAGNAMLDVNPTTGKCSFKTIDFDACLPCGPTTAMGLKNGADRTPPRLPRRIDQPMANAIAALTPEILAGIMRQNGRDITLEPFRAEFNLMCNRLLALQAHVQILDKIGNIIEDPDDWNKRGIMLDQNLENSIMEPFLRTIHDYGPQYASLSDSQRPSITCLVYDRLKK